MRKIINFHRNLAWQCNWRCWRWPWHCKSYDADFDLYAHFMGFGPFQFHWWGR